jgi:LPS export ABC transporter protein LptC
MHLNPRNIAWLVVLAASAFVTWYFGRGQDAAETQSATESTALGYYLTEAVVIGTDTAGKVLYRIAAERVEQNPDTEQLAFHDVLIEYSDQNEIPWRISASSAVGSMHQDYLELEGGVSVESRPDEAGRSTRIEAGRLRLEPRAYSLSTSGPVRFLLGETWIDAVGLSANLKDEEIDLESDVHAQISN